jgi:hypothetical protein
MKTVNSISGGKTSAYIAVNYPADYNVFSLVRTNDKNCMFPDKKLRQEVSDRIGKEFIGTLEMDTIIYTMLDLEQMIGNKIDWVSGKTFDEVIGNGAGESALTKTWLPSALRRYCTTQLKMQPIEEWWKKEINEIVEMRIGFRANETNRANKLLEKCIDGVQSSKFVIGSSKNGRNKWKELEWRIPTFPLISIENPIYKIDVENFWENKSVRFAEINNCVGCFHRNQILLKKMWQAHPNKMEWFARQEDNGKGNWRSEFSYQDVKKWKLQTEISFDDFDECDSGYCGL